MSSTLPSKEWMTAPRMSVEYLEGVASFLLFTKQDSRGVDWFCCPCVKCRNVKGKKNLEVISEHLICDGIDESYTRWIHHGELFLRSRVNVGAPSTSASNHNEDMFPRMTDTLNDKIGCVHPDDLEAHDEDDGQALCDGEARREKEKFSRQKMKSLHMPNRRGTTRTAEELKKESPSSTITKTQLYVATHTKRDETCPFPTMSQQIDEIRRIISSDPFLGRKELDNDPVAVVCGRDGRGRGMGSKVSKIAPHASTPYKEIAQREKRARESLESKIDTIMQWIDEESMARRNFEKKFAAALSGQFSTHGAHMQDSSEFCSTF